MSGKKLLLLVLGAIALLLVGVFLLWNEATKADLEAAKQRLRDAHLPMTIDDIRPPPVPDADNAAPIIAKIKPALAALPQVNGEDFYLWFGNFQGKHKEMLLDEAATRELADQFDSPPAQALLALIHEAAGKKGFNSKTDYSKGANTLFPNISPLQQSAKLLRLQARLNTSRNQMDEAWANVWAEANLADFAIRDPVVISVLTSAAIWGLAIDDLERLAAIGNIPAGWNNKFSVRLSDLKLHTAFATALDTERIVVTGPQFDQLNSATANQIKGLLDLDPFSTTPPTVWERMMFKGYFFLGIVRLDHAHYLNGMAERRQMAASALKNYPSYERRLNSLAETPRFLIVSNITLPTFDSVGKNLWKLRSRAVVAQTGLALERYRAAKGGYPAALAELSPEFIPSVPADVFTGKPLLYRTEPGGALIYSLGPNQTDDGGVENRDDDKDDISWASGTAATRKLTPPSPAPGETEP